MKKLSRWIHRVSIKLTQKFEDKGHNHENGYFGLGQFVLLLAIAPFIFSLELYSIGEVEQVPSLYEYDANRFESLPVYPSLGNQPKAPKKPKALSRDETNYLNTTCKMVFLKLFQIHCDLLKAKQKTYDSQIEIYNKRNALYIQEKAAYQVKVSLLKAANKAYDNFKIELASKPSDQSNLDPEVIERSSRSFTALLGSGERLSAWQDTGLLTWLLGLLLIIPAVLICIRKKYWSLLLCGLLVPTINYLLAIASIVPALSGLSAWQISSSLAAQIAFLWFAIKGHLFSKSFALFIFLLSISVTWAALLGGEDSSIFKAQLPILVFVVAAIIARLMVKGVQENAYLFAGHGWSHNLRKAGHAFLLWLPLACLALPVMYFSSVLIPKTVVNQLHDNKTLRFDYSHDVLDNTLQSVATKTDDAMFAWHLNTENTKRDIYKQGKNLLDTDLRRRVEVAFDQIMPAQLEYEDYESDRIIIGEGIEIAVGAAQDSTNKAFKNMRSKMKRKLGNVADNYNDKFKEIVKDNTPKALAIVDDMYREGRDALLTLNREAQATAWWSINYTRAVHMLTMLLFLFVCLKSYLYVFARASFNRNTGTFVTLGDIDPNKQIEQNATQDSIKATGLNYVIEAQSQETYYMSRRFQCRGKAPNYSIPQPFSAALRRLLKGTYSMNKVVMQSGDDPVQCTATQGVEFFEWTLGEGEVVLFDFRHFVGMSESIDISTLISTRASSLLLGGMIHTQATGPGKLILMAIGRAEVSGLENNGGSVPPERLIATHKDTRFHIDSELDLVNIYLSSAYVRPAGGGQAIVDVDSQRGNKTGLISFIKRFILPI